MSKVSKEECENEAKKIINNFLIEKKISLKDLKDYSFIDIWNDPNYGNGLNYPDGDCCKIVLAIDFLLYNNLPEYSTRYFTNGKLSYNYTGETINTFNTLFAKNPDKQAKIRNLFSQEDWKNIKDDSQSNNPFADDFYHIYQRLGNFMLFPSKTISFRKSINTYKGKNEIILDYSDLFFNELKECLLNKENNNTVLSKLIKANDFYFTKNKSFTDFSKDFFLMDYEEFHINGEHYCHWHPFILENKEIQYSFVNFSLEYVGKAKKLIESRSQLLVNELEKRLEKIT